MQTPSPARAARIADSGRLMWITPDRVFYVGLLGAPAVRTMGAVVVYVAVSGSVRVRLDGGEWQRGEVAVVPPYVPHEVVSEARLIQAVKIEPETVDMAKLPAPLCGRGIMHAPEFAKRVHECRAELIAQGRSVDLQQLDFDQVLFGGPLEKRTLDRRIALVLDRIKQDPSAPAFAEECAALTHLSFSRFLHLFRQEVGAPFRSFRTWRRARSLLHYVHRQTNLLHVALDAGYPDSSHFSHSIRQVYGLKPSDIFAGSRRLAVYGPAPAALN